MSQPAISVENLSKAYRIGLKEEIPNTFAAAAGQWLRAPFKNLARLRSLDTFRRNADGDDLVWALKDVSFEVHEGEVVGVIGRNGAGKSTLLKILSRITDPTRGEARIRGRVSSLLEVGTGFHPELTGRENVYMNATILGMTKREIDRRFDEIVAFSGVEKFLDTPTKRYSSGMQVRLAFAVAAHLDPEILIIDEVLAVGDVEFQNKCLGKMQDVAASGRTVLFVSHNMAAVRALCTRGFLMGRGTLEYEGDSADCVARYTHQHSMERRSREWPLLDAPGKGGVRLVAASVEPASGSLLDMGSGVAISMRLECCQPTANLEAWVELRTMDDYVVLHDGFEITRRHDCASGEYEAIITLPGHLLNCGFYRVRIKFGCPNMWYVKVDDALSFEVRHGAGRHLHPRPGVIAPRLQYASHFLGNR